MPSGWLHQGSGKIERSNDDSEQWKWVEWMNDFWSWAHLGQVDLKLDFTGWPIIPCEFQSGIVWLFKIVLSDQPVLEDSDIFEGIVSAIKVLGPHGLCVLCNSTSKEVCSLPSCQAMQPFVPLANAVGLSLPRCTTFDAMCIRAIWVSAMAISRRA